MLLQNLLEKVTKKDATICVLGLGRVGLPLATVFANCGFKVVGIDISKDRLDSIKNSKCPFYDPALQENLISANNLKNLEVNDDLGKLEKSVDIIFVTVGTPNTKDNNVDYSQVYTALREICKVELKGKMIIMRSTMPPRTTSDIVIPFLENETGMKCGKEFALAVCPERILEGQAIKELNDIPEIIGGVNEISNQIAAELFRKINPKKGISYTTPTGAELAKLFTNIYRYISFALANEFAVWSEIYGVDASEIIKIANFEYERSNIPKPGFVGGPCLSKDGTFLDNNTTFSSIVSAAWKLNESIPQHIINNIKKKTGLLFNKKIAVLGLSFKKGSDDLRNSPSVKLVEMLKAMGANVAVHDPYVEKTKSLSEALESAEIIILATNHAEFKTISSRIRDSGANIIYDVWSMYEKEDFPNLDYLRFGQGEN